MACLFMSSKEQGEGNARQSLGEKMTVSEEIMRGKSKIKNMKSSVVDPERFIQDPDPALNFPSSGSGSRQ